MYQPEPLDQQFKSLITNKSVAILGHGPSLNVCNGKLIDSYETVVRIHGSIPCKFKPTGEGQGEHIPESEVDWLPVPPKEWFNRVGSRTDIFYHNYTDSTGTNFAERRAKEFYDNNGKIWCSDSPWVVLQNLEYQFILDEIIPNRKIPMQTYVNIFKTLGVPPQPGTVAVYDVLRHSPSKLFVGGITNYIENMESEGRTEAYMNSWKDFVWLCNLWRDNERLIVDPKMEALFNAYTERYVQ